MSYSNISDMILEMNKENGNQQKSALALSNTSELEIKNLLKQVDSMIHHKKLRWERQKQELDNKLIAKEQENQTHRMALEQKNLEIAQLRKLLENMDSTTKEIMKKYEKEISNLNQQLSKIKTDYIRVQKKYKKSSKKDDDENEEDISNNSNGGSNSNNNNHNRQAKLTTSNSISNISNDVFHIESCTSGSASSTLNPVCASGHPASNTFKPPKIMTNENNEKTKDKIYSSKEENELIINLKNQLDHYKQRENDYYNEKEKIAKVLDHYKKINQDLIQKVEDLARLNGLTSDNSNEAQTDKLNIDYYRSEIRKRDEYIRNLEALDKADNIELQFYKDEVKKYKKQEITFKNDISKLKKDHEDTVRKLNEIETENQRFRNKAQHEESNKFKNEEIMKKKYEQEKENHLKEIKHLKGEIISFSNQLNEKSHQIKSLTERANCLEKLLKEKEEQLTKTNQELVMTTAHIEALRLENNFLRQSLMEKKSGEREIVEMQKKYHAVLELTEKENRKLKNEIISLSECIESMKSKQNQLISMATKNNNNNIKSNAEMLDNHRSKLLRDEYEQQIETLKRQHELSVKRLNNEIEKLYSEKHAIQMELENRMKNVTQHKSNISSNTDSLSSGLLSNTTNNHINENSSISKRVRSSNQQQQQQQQQQNHHLNNFRLDESTNNLLNRLQSHQIQNQNNNNLRTISNSNRLNTNDNEIANLSPSRSPFNQQEQQTRRLSMTSQLRQEEELRKRTLDDLLENHIEELRRNSDNDKFVNYYKF